MPDGPEATGGEQAADTRFKPGQSGNPAGRPKGSRNKLGEHFLEDLYAIWETDGADVLKDARAEKPMEFAKMVAGLLPKELLVRRDPLEMTEAEIDERLDALEQFLADARGGGTAPRPTHEETGRA